MSAATLERLVAYGWPGNIRELRNVVERLVLRVRGPIVEPSALPAEITSFVPAAPQDESTSADCRTRRASTTSSSGCSCRRNRSGRRRTRRSWRATSRATTCGSSCGPASNRRRAATALLVSLFNMPARRLQALPRLPETARLPSAVPALPHGSRRVAGGCRIPALLSVGLTFSNGVGAPPPTRADADASPRHRLASARPSTRLGTTLSLSKGRHGRRRCFLYNRRPCRPFQKPDIRTDDLLRAARLLIAGGRLRRLEGRSERRVADAVVRGRLTDLHPSHRRSRERRRVPGAPFPEPRAIEDVSSAPMLQGRAAAYAEEGIASMLAIPLGAAGRRHGDAVLLLSSPAPIHAD